MRKAVLSLIFILTISVCGYSAIFTVTSTADNPTPGTLRNAIQTCVPGDFILFNITGTGPFTIALTSALPPIPAGITIDGFSQPGAAAATGPPYVPATMMIVIDGGGFNAMLLQNSGSIIRGLVFINCDNAVLLDGGGCLGNVIDGCYFGVQADGITSPAAIWNSTGILIQNGAFNNLIGGFMIGARNVITGNTFGIAVSGAGPNNQIQSNIIGLDAVSTYNPGLYNATGILMNNTDRTIISSNVISGNYNAGVLLSGCTNTTILANRIGTDDSGMQARPNAQSNTQGAITLSLGTKYTMIGGTSAGTGNLFGGNTIGYGAIRITDLGTDSNKVLGNQFGLASDGITPLPNRYAVYIENSASYNSIGSYPYPGNIIANCTEEGVYINGSATNNNKVRLNTFSCNALQGINLNAGANSFKTYPLFTWIETDLVEGTSNPGDTVELFLSDLGCGNEEGKMHLGFALTNASGVWSYPVSPGQLNAGDSILTTATSTTGSTSEFSPAHVVYAATTPPPPTDTTSTIEVFNAVSPNGDGLNDVLMIEGALSFPDNVLMIFDKEGNPVIRLTGYANTWDGKNDKGKDVPDDTYYYNFQYKKQSWGDYKSSKGFLQVKR